MERNRNKKKSKNSVFSLYRNYFIFLTYADKDNNEMWYPENNYEVIEQEIKEGENKWKENTKENSALNSIKDLEDVSTRYLPGFWYLFL